MKERCPLTLQQPCYQENTPDICIEQCEERWNNAPQVGEYDLFGSTGHHPDDEDQCPDMEVEYLHTAIVAISDNEREYVVVDQCGEGHEIGEQHYKFACPLRLSSKKIISTLDLSQGPN